MKPVAPILDLIKSRWFGLAAKTGLSALVLYLSLRNVDLKLVAATVQSFSTSVLVFGLLICFAQICLVAVRWRSIVLFLGAKLSYWRTLWILEISSFFSQALPATVGIDGVRIFQAWQRGVPIEQAVHSVLLDRVAGVAGLLLAGALGIPFAVGLDEHFGVLLGIAGLSAAAICLAAFYSRSYWLAWLPRRLAAVIGRFIAAGAELAAHPVALAWALLPSIAVQLLSILLIYLALHQLGVPVRFVTCVLLVTPVMLLITLPISIAGWGVREGALVVTLGLSSVPAQEAVTASLLAGLAQLVVALPGGLLLLLSRPDSGRVSDHQSQSQAAGSDRDAQLGRCKDTGAPSS
jgi:uncharacterized protein (TIRG00374 family)